MFGILTYLKMNIISYIRLLAYGIYNLNLIKMRFPVLLSLLFVSNLLFGQCQSFTDPYTGDKIIKSERMSLTWQVGKSTSMYVFFEKVNEDYFAEFEIQSPFITNLSIIDERDYFSFKLALDRFVKLPICRDYTASLSAESFLAVMRFRCKITKEQLQELATYDMKGIRFTMQGLDYTFDTIGQGRAKRLQEITLCYL